MVITRERFDELLDQVKPLNLTMPIKFSDFVGDILVQVDKYTVIARARAAHTFSLGDRFIIVRMGDVIVDPCTKNILGNLEILKGEVELVSQDIFLTLKSCCYESNSKNLLELNSPKRGDFIKLIK